MGTDTLTPPTLKKFDDASLMEIGELIDTVLHKPQWAQGSAPNTFSHATSSVAYPVGHVKFERMIDEPDETPPEKIEECATVHDRVQNRFNTLAHDFAYKTYNKNAKRPTRKPTLKSREYKYIKTLDVF